MLRIPEVGHKDNTVSSTGVSLYTHTSGALSRQERNPETSLPGQPCGETTQREGKRPKEPLPGWSSPAICVFLTEATDQRDNELHKPPAPSLQAAPNDTTWTEMTYPH